MAEDETPPPENRDQSGRFKAGASGNPGGRPKALTNFEDLARSRSVQALDKLWEIAQSGRSMPAVRACEIIIERAWGKAPQPITGGDGGPVLVRDQVNDKLEAMLRAALASKKKPTE